MKTGRLTRTVVFTVLSMFAGGIALADPIHLAVDKNDLDQVKSILAEGADINAVANCRTPILLARTKEMAELLIAKGASVNVVTKDGMTPLFQMAVSGNKDVTEVLLAKGADVNLKNDHGMTALQMTALATRKAESAQVAALLLAKGADINAQDRGGLTALHYATIGDNKPLCEVLLANHAAINATTREGGTPLHRAGSLEVAGLLLDNGADATQKDKRGRIPAETVPAKEVAKFLREAAHKSQGQVPPQQ